MIDTDRLAIPTAFPIASATRLLVGFVGMMLMLTPTALLAQQAAEKRVPTPERDTEASPTVASETDTTDQEDPDALRLYTSDGSGKLRFESADGDVKGRIGGRIMFDFTAGGIGDDVRPATGIMADGTEFRRARLFTEGALYDIGYKLQIDFAGDPDLKSVYLAFPSPVPNSGIKVGKFKEDLSLVESTSSKYITFMARPLLTEFAGGREVGLRLGGGAAGGDLNYGIGVYRSTIDDALGTSQGDGEYKGTGRVAYVPWSTDGGRKLVHLGASGSLASLNADEASSEAHEPEVHLAPDFVNTGDLGADQSTRLGGEAALVYNSFSVQAEYLQKSYRLDAGGDDPTFGAWYVSGSYFLTGEHRPYDGGAFDRLSPNDNFRPGDEGGLGAWEVAARYSTMDLTDSGIVGGEAQALTLGVNWYLNPSVRLMANYTRADVEDAAGTEGVDGIGNFVSVRFQLDF